MKSTRKLLAAVLAVVLALGLAGCNINDTTWVYSYNGEEMPAGVYIYYMLNGFYDGYNELLAAELEKAENDEEYDYTAYTEIMSASANDLLKMEVEGVPVSEWMMRRAEDYVLQHYAVREMFEANGLEFGEDELVSVNTLVSSMMQSNADYYDRNGIAESSVYMQFETDQMKQLLFEYLYDGGEYAVDESELVEAVTEQHTKVQVLTFTKTDEEEEDAEERNAQAKTDAELALARLEAGEAFEDVYFDISFEQAMSGEAGEDPVIFQPAAGDMDFIVTKGYTYSVYEYETSGDYVTFGATISEEAFEQEIDVPVILEDDGAYYVLRRLDVTAGEEYETLRMSALTELKYEEYTEMLTAYGAGLNLQANEASLKRYTVKFLDLG